MKETRIPSERLDRRTVREVLEALSRSSGVALAVVDEVGEPVAAAGCPGHREGLSAEPVRSAVGDGARRGLPFAFRWGAGQWGIGVPLRREGTHRGTLLAGPFRSDADLAALFDASERSADVRAVPPPQPVVDVPLLSRDRVWDLAQACRGLAETLARFGDDPDADPLPERRFGEMLENMPLAAVLLDRDGRVAFCNPYLARELGWEPDEIVGRDWFQTFLPPEVREPVAAIFRRAVDGRTDFPLHHENEVLTRSGEQRRFAWSNTVLRGPDGEVRSAASIGVDVTERQRAEAAIRQSERRLNRAQEMAHVGNWELDLATGSIWGSEEAFRIYGLERPTPFLPLRQVQGQVHVDDRSRLDGALAELVRSGRPYDQEFRIRRADDDGERMIHSRAEVVRDEAGRPTQVLGVLQDVTERWRDEQERQRLEAQVLQAQKLESLGVLAGGIAHDFNNLLAAVLGHADLARLRTAPDAPVQENLREIEKASMRAADLCRQLLAYAGRGRLLVAPVDLSALVEEMAGLIEVSLSKKVLLRQELAAGLPAVEADATQLRQVVLNLITNASEAIGEGTGTVTVSTGVVACGAGDLAACQLGETLRPGAYVYVEVSDTGCGLDAQARARLFDPFFTTKFTGRGLGLAAVLGIVRGHRGAIRISSAPGEGAAFRVLLPPGVAPAAEELPPSAVLEGEGTGTILVVDDEPAVRDVARQMLEAAGFAVITAADGEEGLAVLRRESATVSCIVLDLTMPRKSGDETLRELREGGSAVPVILSSGYGRDEAASRLDPASVAGFVQKPYRAAELVAAVRAALPREGAATPLGPPGAEPEG